MRSDNCDHGADFEAGDLVEFCGETVTVVKNYGTSGVVDLGDNHLCTWYWNFQGEKVNLIARKA